ncbi:hypothetical protein XFF6166_120013 [Xanthomonas citri pv. fuscans]|nr:hypothetical protein XFF6166_120013 [Xanthomonas citri pv. fuscans]SON99342.1 hypothetical protein XFF6960_160093 [Xanthomonas citri pv. fuscans]SOO10630.1 hypothetical protein XFF6970_60094 [Xanthomonas citri pv. fuscans]SOO42968.1 hypothetical protein XFF1815_290093 [Xanthomonas citri pv. fuscans]
MNRLGRLSSSCRRSAHQARWSVSSWAASSRWCWVCASRATAAWPKYRPCAHTSPTWLMRIRPAAWRRCSGSRTTSGVSAAGLGRSAGGLPKTVSSARWASTSSRSSGLCRRVGEIWVIRRFWPRSAVLPTAMAQVSLQLASPPSVPYNPASSVSPSQRVAKFQWSSAAAIRPTTQEFSHDYVHRQVRDRPARLVSR